MNLDEEHWIAIKNILKYLKRTKDLFSIFDGGLELKVERYTNLNFISDVDNRRSISGYIFLCNRSSVSWKNFK